ncbi:D-xylose ABC transporter ATP-binding protein [candidate division KSB1 bacterium]|nr:MAG: D-xylose ABC transporter ATP-binding protein [candidate division KSB1 bacterium]
MLLRLKNISKSYPGVQALDRVSFELKAGEIHALIGENGAGKSTLVKILAGAIQKDSGEIYIENEKIEINSPQTAQRLGISIIYQEFNLSPYLNVAENIFLGREPVKLFSQFIDWKKLYSEAEKVLNKIGIHLDLKQQVYTLSVAQKQIVEIAKALSLNARIIAMDEPSATLTEHELENLFNLIRVLEEDGIGIIYISHRLEEIFEIATRVTVLRDGKYIATRNVNEINKDDIIKMMVGRELHEEFPEKRFKKGRKILSVKNVSRKGVVENISFDVYEGELLGLTGLVGSGRTELARIIFGADPKDEGEIFLNGKKVEITSPRKAISLGIALLTEDRKSQGLILDMSVKENVTIASLDSISRNGFISSLKEKSSVNKFINDLKIKTPSIEQYVRNLSGGNQQKVILARWLFTKSKLLIFDEPTRGIDVGAKIEIYNLINRLIEEGIGIIFISSELPEILGMCDRILVMFEGKINGEFLHKEATQEKIMLAATGGNLLKVN